MSWGEHIDKTITKASIPLNLLKRIYTGPYFNKKVKLSVYKTYIRPILEYGNPIFNSNLTKGQSERLENIQRQALLSSVNAYRHTSHEKLLKESGIEPLAVRRRYFGLSQLYKIVNALVPKYLNDLLPPSRGQINQYQLRRGEQFIPSRSNKIYVRNPFFNSVTAVWNTLSPEIRLSDTN